MLSFSTLERIWLFKKICSIVAQITWSNWEVLTWMSVVLISCNQWQDRHSVNFVVNSCILNHDAEWKNVTDKYCWNSLKLAVLQKMISWTVKPWTLWFIDYQSQPFCVLFNTLRSCTIIPLMKTILEYFIRLESCIRPFLKCHLILLAQQSWW